MLRTDLAKSNNTELEVQDKNMSEAAAPEEVVPPESSAAETEVPEEKEEVAEQQQEECVENVEEHVDNVENEAPKEEPAPVVPACPKLCLLYGESAFPPRELASGVPVSPFIACCGWPERPAKGTHSNCLHPVEAVPVVHHHVYLDVAGKCLQPVFTCFQICCNRTGSQKPQKMQKWQ